MKITRHAIVVLLAFLLLLGMIVSPVCAWTLLWTATGANTSHTDPQINGELKFRTGGQDDFNNNITKFVWVGTGSDYCDPAKGYSGSFTHVYTENGVTKGTADIVWSCTSVGGYNSTATISYTFNNKTGTFGASNYAIVFYKFYEHVDINVNYNTGSKINTVNALNLMGGGGTSYYESGTYYTYGGVAVNTPVANFACDNVFANPGTTIECTDLSSNTPTSWELRLREHDAEVNESADYTDPPWTVQLPNRLGTWDMMLKASNSAGYDWEIKEEYISTMEFPCWTPTAVPSMTSAIWTNITTPNMTAIRGDITALLIIGNMTAPFLDQIDDWTDLLSRTLTTLSALLLFPIVAINNELQDVTSIFMNIFDTLLGYTTLPLAITSKVINTFPWQITAIITIGLVFDVMFLILKGQGGN